MGCATVNLQAVQGDNWMWTATFLDDADDPIDLTVYSDVKMQVRKKPGTTVVAEASLSGNGFSIIGVDDNVLSLDECALPTDVTGVYQFDVELIDAGNVETVIRGTLNILPEITILEP
jgi:hypothetical protein